MPHVPNQLVYLMTRRKFIFSLSHTFAFPVIALTVSKSLQPCSIPFHSSKHFTTYVVLNWSLWKRRLKTSCACVVYVFYASDVILNILIHYIVRCVLDRTLSRSSHSHFAFPLIRMSSERMHNIPCFQVIEFLMIRYKSKSSTKQICSTSYKLNMHEQIQATILLFVA